MHCTGFVWEAYTFSKPFYVFHKKLSILSWGTVIKQIEDFNKQFIFQSYLSTAPLITELYSAMYNQ